MKVALVHDHLNQLGGAERVLKVFSDMFPQSPIFTLIYDQAGTHRLFEGKDVRESFLAHMPFARKKFRWYLPLMISATESYDLSDYDVVLSDSSGLAKGVITGPRTLHICYCHTPTRYLWSDHTIVIDALERKRLVGRFSQLYRSYLRVWDRQAADRVDAFIANSHFIARRIEKYYKRKSDVIYPPIRVADYQMSTEPGAYFLLISRLRPYKRVDLAVQAFNQLNMPLKIVGTGEEEERLREMAKSNITFLGHVSDAEKKKLLAGAKALLHPQEEDFGITPLEAMASGKPVIAYGSGGAVESVIPGKTGVLFDEQSWEALADAVIRFKPHQFDPSVLRQHAETFDEASFRQRISDFIGTKWKEFSK